MGERRNQGWWSHSAPFQAYVVATVIATLLTVASQISPVPVVVASLADGVAVVLGVVVIGHALLNAVGHEATGIGQVVGICIVLLFAAIDVFTGLQFGPREFTGQWAPSVGPINGVMVPVLLPFWLFMVGGCSYLTARKLAGERAAVPLGACMAALFGLARDIEGARALHYWTWRGQPILLGTPLTDLGGWLTVGLIVGWLLSTLFPGDRPVSRVGLRAMDECRLVLVLMSGSSAVATSPSLEADRFFAAYGLGLAVALWLWPGWRPEP